MTYLLSCNQSNVQYVGETNFPLHKRIKVYSRAKSRCNNVIRHVKVACVRIIDVFPGTENKNTRMYPVNRETMLDRDVYWIKTLWASYAYGMNKKKRKFDSNFPVGCSFTPFPRSKQRCARYRHNVNFDNLKDMKSIFNYIHNYITDCIQITFYHIRIFSNNTRRKYL